MSKTALITFDYDGIDAETKGKLISLAGSVKRGRDHYNKSVLELGESIHTAHELLANHGNGTFGKWVEMECGLEVRTAANYMHAWARFKDCEIISQFSPTSMYLLSAPEAPKAAANEAEKRAGKGERITVDKAKEILERFKKPAAEKPPAAPKPKKLPSQSDQPSNGAPDKEPESEPPPPAPAPILDKFKKSVPEKIEPAFAAAEKFGSLMATISDCKSKVKEIGEAPGGEWLDVQEAERLLEQARLLIRFAKPHTECAKCQRKVDKKCPTCKGLGWVNETMFKTAFSDPDKAWLEARA